MGQAPAGKAYISSLQYNPIALDYKGGVIYNASVWGCAVGEILKRANKRFITFGIFLTAVILLPSKSGRAAFVEGQATITFAGSVIIQKVLPVNFGWLPAGKKGRYTLPANGGEMTATEGGRILKKNSASRGAVFIDSFGGQKRTITVSIDMQDTLVDGLISLESPKCYIEAMGDGEVGCHKSDPTRRFFIGPQRSNVLYIGMSMITSDEVEAQYRYQRAARITIILE